MTYYRTRTYIAGDWDGDREAINQLYKWGKSDQWDLSFPDAHELTQARDDSWNCNIKRSLATRLNASKTFVLVVGDNTINLRSGSCQYCNSKNAWTGACSRGYNTDDRSYIEFECEKADKDGLKIVVLYNNTYVDRNKCPESLRWKGTHVAMIYYLCERYYWDYLAIEEAITM